MLPMAVLCGGLATRMYPMTERIPKSLIEVGGRPFIFRQLDLFREKGLNKIVLCAGKFGEMIRDRVGDGGEFGLDVSYSFDGDQLLGTGGAIRKALPLLGDAFFVVYGDSYLECDYKTVEKAFLDAPDAGGLMTVYENRDRYDSSNVVFRDNQILVYDKKNKTPEMAYIDYGLGILRRETMSSASDAPPFDLSDVYTRLSKEGRLAGVEMTRRFYEIGSPEGLAELDKRFRNGEDA